MFIDNCCNTLTCVDLMHCQNVSSVGAIHLANCHKLKYVGLHNCTCVSNVSIHALLKGCPDIESLDIRRSVEIDDELLAEIAQSFKRLKRVSVNMNSAITDAGILHFVDNCPLLSLDNAN